MELRPYSKWRRNALALGAWLWIFIPLVAVFEPEELGPFWFLLPHGFILLALHHKWQRLLVLISGLILSAFLNIGGAAVVGFIFVWFFQIGVLVPLRAEARQYCIELAALKLRNALVYFTLMALSLIVLELVRSGLSPASGTTHYIRILNPLVGLVLGFGGWLQSLLGVWHLVAGINRQMRNDFKNTEDSPAL